MAADALGKDPMGVAGERLIGPRTPATRLAGGGGSPARYLDHRPGLCGRLPDSHLRNR